jgi:hypothetical protein
MQAITSDQAAIPADELRTAATQLQQSPQFQNSLRALATALDAQEIALSPDWHARLRAYVKAQLAGERDLAAFADVQQHLARSVELTQGYLALYDEMEQQQQQRRKLTELGLLLLVGLLGFGVAFRLLQQDRPEWGVPLLTLTLFGLGFSVAAQFMPRPISQLLRQELLGSYRRLAVSSTMIVLIVFSSYTFQSLLYHRSPIEQMSATIGATDLFSSSHSTPVSLVITPTQSVQEFSALVTGKTDQAHAVQVISQSYGEISALITNTSSPLFPSCDSVDLLQPNQPVRHEIHPDETDLYDVALLGPGTFTLSILAVAPSLTPPPLDVRFYHTCIGNSLTGELAAREIRNQAIDLQDPQTTLSLPVRQQIFTLQVEEIQNLIRVQLHSRPENPSPMFYVLSSGIE